MSTELLSISEKDIPAVAEIEKSCFSAPWSEETLISELKNPLNLFFGIFEDGKLCGYIGGQTVAGETSIFNVGVLPEFRRRGFGKALVEHFIAEVKPNTDVIFLEVRPRNLAAIGLYEKEGFVFCGIRKDYYTNPKEDAILMRLAFDGTQECEDPIECWDEE